MVIGSGVGQAIRAVDRQPSKALVSPHKHEFYGAIKRARDYLKEEPHDTTITVPHLHDLLNDFMQDTGIAESEELIRAISMAGINQLTRDQINYQTAAKLVRAIDRIEADLEEIPTGQDRPFVQITPAVRAVVDRVITSLLDLDEVVRKSNEVGSQESALSEVQRQTIIAQARSIIELLQGPVADQRTLTEFADMLGEAAKEGAKKGISDTVREALIATRDQLFGLVDTLSSVDLTSWRSLKDIL